MGKGWGRLESFICNLDKDSRFYTLVRYDEIDTIYEELKKEPIKDPHMMKLVRRLRDEWVRDRDSLTKLYDEVTERDEFPDDYLPEGICSAMQDLYDYYEEKYG